ncbi:MAG: hypothetical protein J1F69_04010 [Clostridiales bacterium]|nr:hypothetical protein [Clostridiales bacterium]
MKRTNNPDKNIKLARRMLLMLATVITAIAVAVTCALCIDSTLRTAANNSGQGKVSTSATNLGALTGTAFTTKVNAGQVAAGDYLSYAYTGNYQSIQLPKGTYKFEVWGAKGGSKGSNAAGSGGYAYGQINVTAATYYYIYCGGIGADSQDARDGSGESVAYAGGYNGGGNGSGVGGPGGGGATDIRTTSGTASTASSYNTRIIVAAGGGGGASGSTSTTTSDVRTSAVTYQGEHGCTSKHNGSYCNDEGGGGGGYQGGATKHGDDTYTGYAGTNYVSGSFTSTGNSYGQNAAAGKAVITVINVNQPPTNKSASVTVKAVGNGTTAVAASTLATDPEGTTLAFTANSSSNYDTLPAANAGVWVNSACSTLATKYFTWTWAASTLTLTTVKYPRNGTDGSTADGKIILYTYVRDSFGSTTTRGVVKVSFTVTVPVNTVSLKTGVVSGQSNVGSSTTTTAPADPATASAIYNPNGTGRNTLFIKKSLEVGVNYTTITAASLLNSVKTTYDQAVIAINSTTAITGSARKYSIVEVDGGTSKVTAYLANKTVIANAYSQITIKPVTPDQNYIVLPITIYTVEKSTAFGTSYPNVVPGIATVSLEIVFKMENARPILKSGQSNLVDIGVGATGSYSLATYFSDADGAISTSTHSITGVSVPANEFVLIDKQRKVIAAANYNVGNAVGKVFDASDAAYKTTATGSTATNFKPNIAYNATSPVSGTVKEQAFMSFTYSGITLSVTGLRASFSQYLSNRSVTPLGHFYLLIHIQDNRDTADKGIWLPLAFTVGNATSHTPVATVTAPNSLTSQTAVSTFPTAAGAPNQSFYFAPMAINYGGSYVVGKYKPNGTGALTNSGLQPLAIDGDNFSTSTGLASWGGKLNELLRLSTTPEAVVKSVSTVNVTNSGGVWENQYIKAETIPIYIEKTMFATAAYSGGRVVAASGTNANGFIYVPLTTPSDEPNYFTIDGLKITLKSATMDRYIYAQAGVKDVTGKTVTGIKIAIRVKNTALGVYAANSGNVVTFGNPTSDSVYSTYEYATNGTPTFTYKVPLGGTVMVTPYDLAYDYDMRTAGASSAGGFTLNGYSGRYNPSTGLFTTGSTSSADGSKQVTGLMSSSYNSAASTFLSKIVSTTAVLNVSSTASGTASNSAIVANQNMYRDKLFFARTNDSGTNPYTYNPTTFNNISVGKSNTTNFVDVEFGTNVKIGSATYPVDFMLITAKNRTTQPSVIDLVIRDRYGSNSSDGTSTANVRILIEIINSKPLIKNANYSKELSAKAITSGAVTPNNQIFYANGNGSETGLMTDPDGDVPEYITQQGLVIVNKSFINDYNNNTLTKQNGDSVNSLTYSSFDGMAEKYLVYDGRYLTSYLTAEILSRRELLVTAISSTKGIDGGVYIAFFVTDNNGGTSLGYFQIEVINTLPVLNEADENGFDPANPLWSIQSTSDSDIMRSRYIVGSTLAATKLKSARAALDMDIKLIAVDEDGLHNKVLLSQVTASTQNNTTVYSYVNLNRSGAITRDMLEAAVPVVLTDASSFNSLPSAVKVFTRNGSAVSGGAPSGFNTEIYFWIGDEENGAWYNRSSLIDALVSNANDILDECFDSNGRFIVADWAVHLHATSGFEDNVDAGILLSLRDQAEFGGDTAGIATAFNTNRSAGKITVDGKLIVAVYQHISKTGIRSINEYLGQNNDYYTVEYAPKDGDPVRFISTFDNNPNSTYDETQDPLYFTSRADGYVLSNDGDEANLIKKREVGTADNTKAGTNSGAVYNGTGEVNGAFKYLDTIEVPAAVESGNMATGGTVTYKSVYVPMSYFGLLSTLVGANTGTPLGSVVYPTNEFVGYELSTNTAINLNNINQILPAMSLSDGTYVWTGTEIASNPYITIGTFDWYHDGDPATNSARLWNDPYSKPYYNNRLAVVTVSSDDGSLVGYEQYPDNRNSFVGDGRLMYLEDQATKLIEHNFGLTFTKKNLRTGTRNLTLTINLARYQNDKVALTGGVIAEQDKSTVEIKIHVENSKLDLFNNENNTSNVKYDAENGTYYTDVTLPSSGSWSYKLSRRASSDSGVITDGRTIEYYDDDYGTSDKRDFAYFLSDSFVQLDQWQVDYTRVLKLNNDQDKFLNVLSTSTKAQKSVARYFGVNYDEGLSGLEASGSVYKSGKYQANNGLYGVLGREGYSSYFSASLTDNNTTLNIIPVRKTLINEIAFTNNLNGLNSADKNDQQKVAAAYRQRGLIAEYANSGVPALEPTRVYYPFNVLIFDSYGVGFGDASYVAIEFRITITNGDPTLKQVGTANGSGRQYSMNLAVNNTAAINLYDIVYDSDIYTYTQNSIGMLATQKEFQSRARDVQIETGDYLDSPLKHDAYKGIAYNPAVQTDSDGIHYYNGGGFVIEGSEEYRSRDVVMWMDGNGEVPETNIIMFRVNRRTTALLNNKGVSIDRYKFTLKFYDGEGSYTQDFTFIINITNQAPSITQINRSFTMRAGDDLTILTSYYDVFTDGKSTAYRNSDTYAMLDARENSAGYGVTYGDGENNAERYWKFKDMTTAAVGGNHVTYDSTENRPVGSGPMHLGYVGLARDDTPWRLRITDWTPSNSKVNVYSGGLIQLRDEGSAENSDVQQIALRIIARAACVNEPITVTISDGEEGIISCTLYITIVSSPPEARNYTDPSDNKIITDAGLEGVANSLGGVARGVFNTYIVPADGTHTFNVSGVGQKTARRVVTIRMSDVAKDPDGDTETNNMHLYGNGEFTLNDQTLASDSRGVYSTEYFDIQPNSGGLSFTITATGFNPNTTRGYEEITFRIADYGDSSLENTLLITLRIYTLYSDMINPNAAVKTGNDYTSYLKGSDAVNVKSYDVYFNPSNPVDESRLAFLKLTNNDGIDNTLSPIVDPDAQKVGDASYNVKLYALINVQDDGTVKALPADTLSDMFYKNAATKSFSLDDGNYAEYLIGGITDGKALSYSSDLIQSGRVRYDAILKYASFEFASDGTALMLTPRASTLNSSEILLYVEVEKPLGQRAFYRTDAVLRAGALFRLNVKNSAPNAVDGRHEIIGAKGDVGTLAVFDPDDRYGALFMDSDNGDMVTLSGIVDNKLADSEYANVMSKAEAGLDWQADAAKGKPRAFDISVNSRGELEIKINRRIDYVEKGVYSPSVTIPLVITGHDVVGDTATTTIYLTINNSASSTVDSYSYEDENNTVGYAFGRDLNDDYVMNVRLRYGVALEVNLDDILIDADMDENYDADSYRFVLPKSQGGYTYLTDNEIEVNWYDMGPDGRPNIDTAKTLATAAPIGKDSLHRTGIIFKATETERDLTATVYVRILDRSTNGDIENTGIVIKINVTVMNDAPYVREGMETTTIYMIGSEDANKEPASMLFFIGDFVADKNASDVVGDEESAKNPNTYLRIARQESRAVDKLYSQKYTSIPESFGITGEITSSALFEVTYPTTLDDNLIRDYRKRTGKGDDFVKDSTNDYNQWFVIKPRRGFYGHGAVDITVVDGDSNVKYDTLYTTFCIEVHVISNPDEVIDSMVDIELACSKTRQIDIRSLMPDLQNKLNTDKMPSDSEQAGGESVFSQYEYYEIVNVGFQNDTDRNKATFTKLDESGQLWQLKAGNQVTREPVRVQVDFALKSDKSTTYKKYFYLNIIPNRSPKIKYSQIEFKRYTNGEEADELRSLNEANSIRLQAWQLFEDPDDPEGTAIRFLSVKSKVSSIVKANLVKDENGEFKYLELIFVARGESEITVTVTDETGTPVELKFVASNKDLPEASLWVKIAASFEANTVMWIVLICVAVLVLVILIIIIAVIRRKKREREEIEALLISEMEIEEQMLKLAGGPSPTDYQSYGYLPGAGAMPQPDPSMMLGAGMEAPQQQLTALPPASDTPPSMDNNGNGEMPM